MTTITWHQDDGAPDATITITDEVMASLETYRKAQTAPVATTTLAPDGITKVTTYVTAPVYPTVRDMFIGSYAQGLLRQVLAAFPPTSIQALKAQADAAAQALQAAKDGIVINAVTVNSQPSS